MIRRGGRALPSVVLVTDPRWELARIERVVEEVGRGLARGAFAVQLRDKAAPPDVLVATARVLRAVTARVGALFVVNAPNEDTLRIAAHERADGVHVPSVHEAIVKARALFGETAWISAPAHEDSDVSLAASAGATAALVSPIFETPGKGAPRGVGALANARRLAVDLGLYALGGVEPSRATACASAGADGVAVIRALLDAPDPAATALAFDAPFRAARPMARRAGAVYSRAPMPTYDETLQITTEILKKHVDGDRTIRPNDHIQNDLGLDSLGVMEVVADVEDRFSVAIPNDVLGSISTVEEIARALVKLQDASAQS